MIDIGQQPVRMSKGLSQTREPNKKSTIKTMLNDFLFQLDNYGIYAGSIAIVSVLVEFEIKRKQAETLSLRNLYRAVKTVCENIRHMLVQKLRDIVDDDDVSDDDLNGHEVIMNFSTPKMQKFLQYLKSTFGNKKSKDIRCLVFVERRYTCKCIYGLLLNFIATTPELRNVLVPQFMVGRNGINPDFDNLLEQRWQKTVCFSFVCYNNTNRERRTCENPVVTDFLLLFQAIQSFRDGEANLMICSSVLEEGIDVQACNYVIILDPLKTFNMYVQTKGRARSKNASYILFSSDIEQLKISAQIGQYRQAHDEIGNYLKERVLERAEPQMDEINEHFQDEIQPYVNANGAVLLASGALSLLHRYCQQLPSDAFGIVQPWFKLLVKEEVKQRTSNWTQSEIVSVTLPLNTSLRDPIYVRCTAHGFS